MKLLLALMIAFAFLPACGSKKGSGTASTKVVASKSARLTWAASSGSPSGYVVEMSTDNSTFTTATTVTGLTALVSGLTPGRTYYFRIKGYNGGGNSTASNVITITP